MSRARKVPCPGCGIRTTEPESLCATCCRREAALLVDALDNPRFVRAFDAALIEQAMRVIGGAL